METRCDVKTGPSRAQRRLRETSKVGQGKRRCICMDWSPAKTHRSENGQQGSGPEGPVERCWGPRQGGRGQAEGLCRGSACGYVGAGDATISGRGAKVTSQIIPLPGSEDGLDR